jgi:RND family efflux transporter MFP subunit
VIYNSNAELYKEGSISTVEYHNSLSTFKNAQALLQGAKAALESRTRALHNSQFFSPVDGRIVDLPIRVGQTITIGQRVAGIVDAQTLMIRTGVSETAIRAVSRGQTVTVSHRNNGESHVGRITGIGYRPLANITSFPIEIEIDNRAGKLIPGMVVSCEILSNVNRNVIYVPMSIILREFDTDFVFVIDANNVAHRRNVVLGRQVRENTIITSGLAPGEKLVIEGHDRIRDGSRVIVRSFD